MTQYKYIIEMETKSNNFFNIILEIFRIFPFCLRER